MIHQPKTTSQKIGKLYDFMDFKAKRPFFVKPMKITIDTPRNDTFYMVKNVVYKEKQILALKKEQDPNTIVIVEAKIENGKLTYVSRIPDEFMTDITRMLEETV